MADDTVKGVKKPTTGNSVLNALDFLIDRQLGAKINTSMLVRVDSVDARGPEGPAGYVSGTPMVAQTDADGNALPMASIPKMPFARLQGGIAAVVLDPVPGDLALASFCKRDISTVGQEARTPQRPGSYRNFDEADGVMVGTVLNKAPEVWIELRQDRTIIIHAPEGVTIETDKSVTVNAGESVTVDAARSVAVRAGSEVLLDAPVTRITGDLIAGGEGGANITMTGNISLRGDIDQQGRHASTGDQVAGGISQISHTHTGVQSGGDNTGTPQ